MKTANGILTLIQEYAVDYHDGYYAKATANRLVKLRTAIEELHRDAARHKFVVKSPIHAVCEWNPPRQMGCTGWYELDEEQLDAAMEAHILGEQK